MFPHKLKEIQALLQEMGSAEAKASVLKFVPTSQKVYGVRVPHLNRMAHEFKNGGTGLVLALWKSGAFEERLLAAKILGKIGGKSRPAPYSW